jgi:hypothetical protein
MLAALVQEEKLTIVKAVYRLQSGEIARLL